jgi:hypothetical protein
MNNKQVAEELDRYAAHFPEDCDAGSALVAVTVDGLTLRFRPSRKALKKVADKFRKNRGPKAAPKQGAVHCHGPRELFKQFCADGETGNAVQLAHLKNLPVIFSAGRENNPNLLVCLSAPVRGYEDFVVGRIYDGDGALQPWEVYHVPSGSSCGSAATSKEASLLKFDAIPVDKLERAVKSAADRGGFQQQALAPYQPD